MGNPFFLSGVRERDYLVYILLLHGFFTVKIKKKPYINFFSHRDNYGEEPNSVNGETTTYVILK